MIAIAIAALITTQAPTPAQCSLSALSACQNTNQLVWTPAFNVALRQFLGHRKVDWIDRGGNIYDQASEAIGGSPDEPKTVSDQLIRFSACRDQSAEERGAVFITPTGQIQMVAILHFHCAATCEKAYTLSIVLHRHNPQWVSLARKWGDENMAANIAADANEPHPSGHTTISHVEIITTQE